MGRVVVDADEVEEAPLRTVQREFPEPIKFDHRVIIRHFEELLDLVLRIKDVEEDTDQTMISGELDLQAGFSKSRVPRCRQRRQETHDDAVEPASATQA